jgi:hypothetical protein
MLQFLSTDSRKMKLFLKTWIEPKNNDSVYNLSVKMQIKLSLTTIMKFRNTTRETTGNH